MACERWQADLWNALDGELPEAAGAELAIHLRGCGPCRTLLRTAVGVHRGCLERGLLPLIPPAPATGTHRPRTRPVRRPRKTGGGSGMILPIAGGLAALLALLVAVVAARRPEATAPEPRAVAVPAARAPVPVPPRTIELDTRRDVRAADGSITGWGAAIPDGAAPRDRIVDGDRALCLDGATQGMRLDPGPIDTAQGFALIVVAHATTAHPGARLASLAVGARELAALVATADGYGAVGAAGDERVALSPRGPRIALALRVDGDGSCILHDSTGGIVRGRWSVPLGGRGVRLHLATGPVGKRFEGNLFAVQLLVPAPPDDELVRRLLGVASDFRAGEHP